MIALRQHNQRGKPALPPIKPGTNTSFGPLKQIDAGVLNVGYAEAGPADGPPVILLHGWPYDIHSYVDVAPLLASAGYRVIVPYLRGYGTTRFLSSETPRNGQPSVARRRHDRLDGCAQDREGDPRRLRLGRAHRQHHRGALAGALQGHGVRQRLPDRQPGSRQDAVAAEGRARVVVPVLFRHRARPAGYDKYRREFSKLIWQLASPKWDFDDATFDRSAAAFDNPDHVGIVIHNYRWRLGLAEGEPKYDDMEKRLAEFPVITVPTITLEGDANGAPHPDPSSYAKRFSGRYAHRLIAGGIGHNLPQEAPQAFAEAVIDVGKADRKSARWSDPRDDGRRDSEKARLDRDIPHAGAASRAKNRRGKHEQRAESGHHYRRFARHRRRLGQSIPGSKLSDCSDISLDPGDRRSGCCGGPRRDWRPGDRRGCHSGRSPAVWTIDTLVNDAGFFIAKRSPSTQPGFRPQVERVHRLSPAPCHSEQDQGADGT